MYRIEVGERKEDPPIVECEFTLRGHSSAIRDVIWRCETGLIVAVCTDGVAFVWQLARGTLERRVAAAALFTSDQSGQGDEDSYEPTSAPRHRARTNSLVRSHCKSPQYLL